MSEWYYARHGQQTGPVASEQLQTLVARGELQPTDMIWRAGMPQWLPASQLDQLVTGPAAAVPQPARPLGAGEIGYFNPTAGLQARVAQTLKGFSPPRGDQSTWPLNEGQLADLAHAEKHRKALRNFNSLCQLMALLSGIAFVAMVVTILAGATTLRRGGPPVAAIPIAFLYVALTILYYTAGRAALRCRSWAPITVTSLFAIGMVFSIGSMVYAIAMDPAGGGAILIPLMVALGIGGAMLAVCVRAIRAVPRFLESPVWAQEALVNAKL